MSAPRLALGCKNVDVIRELNSGATTVRFGLPIETKQILNQAKRFAATNLAKRDQGGLDRIGWSAVAEFGMFRLVARQSADGNRGALVTVAMLEGMGLGGADRGLLFAIGAHLFGCLAPLTIYGTASHVTQWEEGLRAGTVVGALAVTESRGGSSLEHIETAVVETKGGYLLTGRKILVANAPEAGVFIVVARQFPDRGPLGLTAFLVPGGSPGLIVSPIATAAGLPGTPMGDVMLDQCLVPSDSVLAKPGAGLQVFSTAMQWERSCLLAGFLGAADHDLAACIEVLRVRSDHGGSLLRHQAVSHRLARTQLKLEGARLLAYRAAACLDDGRDDIAAAAMAKLAVSELVVAAAEDGVHLLAGMTWQRKPIDFTGALNDTLGGLFASGTSEIQLEILARSMQAGHRGQ